MEARRTKEKFSLMEKKKENYYRIGSIVEYEVVRPPWNENPL